MAEPEYDGIFRPEDPKTRELLVALAETEAFLWREWGRIVMEVCLAEDRAIMAGAGSPLE